MGGKLYHDPRQVVVYAGRRTYLFCSITLVQATFGLKTHGQVERLIETGQNIPNSNVFLDWADEQSPKVRWFEDVTEDMMSENHLEKMKRAGVRVVDDGENEFHVPQPSPSSEPKPLAMQGKKPPAKPRKKKSEEQMTLFEAPNALSPQTTQNCRKSRKGGNRNGENGQTAERD